MKLYLVYSIQQSW